jgi:hypothetical protein
MMLKLPQIFALNPQHPFAVFDLTLSPVETSSLDGLVINQAKAYNNFGNLGVLTVEAQEFLGSLGANAVEATAIIARLISSIVDGIILHFNKETAWVTIRAATATDTWDLPRWHSDGYYYAPYVGEQYKAAITLKGATSLFYQLPLKLQEQFNALQMDPDNRTVIAKLLDPTLAVSIKHQQGVIFIVGANYAAVHSEPPIHEPRLFFSVVPGNKTQIDELYNNWHPKKA